MIYQVIYECAGQKVFLGNYKNKQNAKKRAEKEKTLDDFGKNGFREYILIVVK